MHLLSLRVGPTLHLCLCWLSYFWHNSSVVISSVRFIVTCKKRVAGYEDYISNSNRRPFSLLHTLKKALVSHCQVISVHWAHHMFLSDDEEHLMLNQFSFISAGKLKHLTTQEKPGDNWEIKLDVELDSRDWWRCEPLSYIQSVQKSWASTHIWCKISTGII